MGAEQILRQDIPCQAKRHTHSLDTVLMRLQRSGNARITENNIKEQENKIYQCGFKTARQDLQRAGSWETQGESSPLSGVYSMLRGIT